MIGITVALNFDLLCHFQWDINHFSIFLRLTIFSDILPKKKEQTWLFLVLYCVHDIIYNVVSTLLNFINAVAAAHFQKKKYDLFIQKTRTTILILHNLLKYMNITSCTNYLLYLLSLPTMYERFMIKVSIYSFTQNIWNIHIDARASSRFYIYFRLFTFKSAMSK